MNATKYLIRKQDFDTVHHNHFEHFLNMALLSLILVVDTGEGIKKGRLRYTTK